MTEKSPGYFLEKVTIQELFATGETNEPSEKALRARANRRHGILVFVESVGNTHYYDKQLSIIRVNAARRCKESGVSWGDISSCLKKVALSTKTLKEMLDEGMSKDQVTRVLADELSSQLDKL